MATVGRTFSLEPRISEKLNELTRIPGKEKGMNISSYVNMALDWYMNNDLSAYISEQQQARENLTEAIKKRDQQLDRLLSSRGVKHHLAGLLKCLNPYQRRKREEQPKQ